MTTAMREMPALGMGTFRLEGKTAYNAVKMALETGFRHIDTAQIYNNEEQVGQAIADSGLPRNSLFVTTKVWNSHLNQASFIDSVKESLKKLQSGYVDLLLIHWPAPENGEPMAEYLAELMKAKQLGLAKHIGVSNFTVAQLKEALELLPVGEIYTNQIEVHPYLTNTVVREFCAEHGIHVTGYMPFAVGKVLKDETIRSIAEKYGRHPAEVVIAWELANGLSTIPSSTKRENLLINLQGQSLTLTSEDIARINALDCGDRQANPEFSPKWDQ